MKKTITLLIYLLMINLLVCLLLVIDINNNKPHINESIIINAMSNSDNYNLIVQILKDTHKEDFIKYTDYMQLDIYKTIENDKNNYTAFTITLPQNKSFIAFYKKNNNNTYSFNSLVDDLDEINDFYFFNDFLIVEQSCENKNNHLNDKEFVEIFFKENSSYVSKLEKDIYVEISNASNNSKNILSATIDFLEDIPPKILYIKTYLNGEDNSDKEVSKEVYTWDPELNQFTIHEKENPIDE